MTTNPIGAQHRRGWHRSSYVFGCVLFGFVAIANIPGRRIATPSYEFERHRPPFACRTKLEHGWPWTFLRNSDRYIGTSKRFATTGPWSLNMAVEDFCAGIFLADVALGLALVAVGAWLHERWRRRRTRWLQFYLNEAVFGVAVVCMLAAWVANRYWQCQVEQTFGADEYDRQEAGPSWLRDLAGDRVFRPFDRPGAINIRDAGKLAEAAKCRKLRVLRLCSDEYTNEDLAAFSEFSNLEALDLGGGNDERLFRLIHQFRDLRALDADLSRIEDNDLAGFKHLTRLEVLDLTETEVGDDGVAYLVDLAWLRFLSLAGSKITDAATTHLETLPRLDELWLNKTELTDKGLQELSRMSNLRILGLAQTQITDAGLMNLTKSRTLEYLDVSGTLVTARGIHTLRQMLPRLDIDSDHGSFVATASVGY